MQDLIDSVEEDEDKTDTEFQEKIKKFLETKQDAIANEIPDISFMMATKSMIKYITEIADNKKSEIKFVFKFNDLQN